MKVIFFGVSYITINRFILHIVIYIMHQYTPLRGINPFCTTQYNQRYKSLTALQYYNYLIASSDVLLNMSLMLYIEYIYI